MELNRTEVSHSSDLVGMEVFAEPESTICLRGRKMENSKKVADPSISDTFVTISAEKGDSKAFQKAPSMIKALESVSKTWFFQCGKARSVQLSVEECARLQVDTDRTAAANVEATMILG